MIPAQQSMVITPHGARYLGQLCTHFAHKITVDYVRDQDPNRGLAHFPWGECEMQADATTVTFTAKAPDAPSLERVKAAIDSHLRRFAWREELTISWVETPA